MVLCINIYIYIYIYIYNIISYHIYKTKPQGCKARLFQWFSENQMKGNKDKCHLVTYYDQR